MSESSAGKNLELTFSRMDRSSAHEIILWRYPAPYDIYNLEECEEAIRYVLNPKNNFYVMRDSGVRIVGFCSFGEDGQVPGGDYGQDALDIGMGIRPDLTGKGCGVVYARNVLWYAHHLFSPPRFRVTIATFNHRAQRVWTRCGFRPVQKFLNLAGNQEFIVLVCELEGLVESSLVRDQVT